MLKRAIALATAEISATRETSCRPRRPLNVILMVAFCGAGCQLEDSSLGEAGPGGLDAGSELTEPEGLGGQGVGEPGSALNPIVLTDGCPSCRILFDTVIVIGDLVGPGMIDGWGLMTVDDAGRYYISNGSGTGVRVFSSDGEFIRNVGRPGEGPGELKMARNVHVDDRGNLYLGDVLNARVNVFDSLGAVARTIPAREPQPGFTVLPLPGDSLLIEGHRMTPELWGLSVHVISPDGERVRSFGEPPYEVPNDDPYYHHRALAWAGPEEVWIGGWHRYYIELWSLAGERIRTFVRDVEWFRYAIPGSGGPRPVVNSLQQDSSGLLWVHGRVPAAVGVGDAPSRLDPFVEVIDPAAGQVLASVRLRGQSTPLFGDRLIGFLSIDLDSGLVQMVILRARLGAS